MKTENEMAQAENYGQKHWKYAFGCVVGLYWTLAMNGLSPHRLFDVRGPSAAPQLIGLGVIILVAGGLTALLRFVVPFRILRVGFYLSLGLIILMLARTALVLRLLLAH